MAPDTAPAIAAPAEAQAPATAPAPATRLVRVLSLTGLVLTLVSSGFAIFSDVVVAREGAAYAMSPGWSGALPGLALAIPGALLFWRLPWHPIASTFLLFGVLWAMDGAASAWVNLSFALDADLPGLEFAVWFYTRLGAILILPFVLLLVLFPDGRLPERPFWRLLGWVAIVAALLPPVYAMFVPPNAGPAFENADAPPPELVALDVLWIRTPIPVEVWTALGKVLAPALVVGGVSAFLVLLSRWIRADAVRRSQLRWLIWAGFLLLVVGFIAESMLRGWVAEGLLTASLCLLCFAVVIAVTRYRLYAIDSLFSWTLVYGALVAGILVLDVGIVTVAGSVLGEQSSALLAVVLVGLAFAPMRNALFRLANRLVSGRRSDPYGVVTRLAARLEVARGLPAQLEAIAEAVADAFASPSVELRVERGGLVAVAALHGSDAARTVELPLEYRGTAIGRILLAPGRRPRLSERDQRLLDAVIRQAAAAATEAEASVELRRIRRELVLSREAERLRLRRDLHDGLGPLVASIRLRVETAANLLDSAPDSAEALLAGAADDAAEAVREVRRIVDGLRPPALDDLGVAGAIRAQANRFSGERGRVRTSIELSGAMPAAVEIAAYRIVSEALANAARHAGASRVEVEVVGTSEGVSLRIADDGVGIGDAPRLGTGLASQRERAEELGGTWRVARRPDGGTEVVAWLPVAEQREEQEMAHVG
ncbi:histidine kinase [Naasia sp. SYSU D00948]|uniref:sensor histidine kinase n=1 Tax=Naasia sp. SYSU D00948 TaxID=2817379 RepID=UPI001B3068FC|nr:histidine kinase [Naasia sp. SYSU D00948]